MDAELLGFEVASIRDTTGAEEAPEQEPEREREPEPVYDPSKHKSGIVPELQCAGSALCSSPWPDAPSQEPCCDSEP